MIHVIAALLKQTQWADPQNQIFNCKKSHIPLPISHFVFHIGGRDS